MIITAQHNQSLLDIAIQEYGDASAAVLMAIENEISIDYVPLPGEKFINGKLIKSNAVATYMKARGINPSTMTEQAQELFQNGLFENGLFK